MSPPSCASKIRPGHHGPRRGRRRSSSVQATGRFGLEHRGAADRDVQHDVDPAARTASVRRTAAPTPTATSRPSRARSARAGLRVLVVEAVRDHDEVHRRRTRPARRRPATGRVHLALRDRTAGRSAATSRRAPRTGRPRRVSDHWDISSSRRTPSVRLSAVAADRRYATMASTANSSVQAPSTAMPARSAACPPAARQPSSAYRLLGSVVAKCCSVPRERIDRHEQAAEHGQREEREEARGAGDAGLKRVSHREAEQRERDRAEPQREQDQRPPAATA